MVIKIGGGGRRKRFIGYLPNLILDRVGKCINVSPRRVSAFLKADEREKSEILEQITNSNIYREIGKRVYQEAKDKKSEIEKLEYLLDIEKLYQIKLEKSMEDSIDRLIRDIRLYTIGVFNLESQIFWILLRYIPIQFGFFFLLEKESSPVFYWG